jgi:hypothetical protein
MHARDHHFGEEAMRSLVSAFAVLVTAVPSIAAAQSGGAVDRGSWLVGGSGRFARQTVEVGSGDATATTFELSPNLLYFVAHRVAIGGQLAVSTTDTENGSGSTWLIGPAARVYLAPSSSRMLPYLGLAVATGRSSFESDDSDAEGESSTWGVQGVAGITWMMSRQVGLTIEGFFDRSEDSFELGDDDTESTVTGFGLRFGFAAFLFR